MPPVAVRTLRRAADRVSPSLSLQLRLVRKKLRRDMSLTLINRLVTPGQHVVDIGAYRGVYTLALSRRVGGRGRVWAIEPFPPNLAALRVLAARRANITVCAGAASNHAGRQTLAVPVFRGHRLGALATLGTPVVTSDLIEVDLVTVDGILAQAANPTPEVGFVRCDVVGHEAAALRGAEGVLRAHLPLLLVEIEQRHQSGPIQETLDHLLGHGYDGYFIKEHRVLPLSQFDLERDQNAFVGSEFVPYGMPSGYVHYFLFARPGTDIRDLDDR